MQELHSETPDRRVLHTPELTFPRTSICVIAIRSDCWQELHGKLEFGSHELVRRLKHLRQLLLDGKAGRAICLIPTDTRTSGQRGAAHYELSQGSFNMPSLQLPAGGQTQHDAVVLTDHTPGGDNDQYFHLGNTFAYIYTHHAHLRRQQLRLPYADTAVDGRLLAAIFNASALGLTKEGIDPYPLSAVRHACMNYHNVSGGDHMDDAKAFASLINK
jgi:hypothetical protein